ncbi:MAG TPA: PaaI family thioesterase [Candidatus Acidoferrum sp.]|nr:PaaI family thioesterase [Candidatus Acidoferrum sp.]
MTDRSATELMHEAMPFCATLGARADKYSSEEVMLTLDWAPGLCTTGGIMHGGAIMALADSAGAACALLNLPKDASGTATIESKTNFLGAVRSGTVTATATPLHAGGTTIVVETSVHDGGGRMVAKVTQTQIVLRPKH